MRKKLLLGFLIMVVALLLYPAFVGGGFPYIYASYLEHKWRGANPKTRAQLEGYLHLYSERVIDPSESPWGKNYKLAAGQRMIQYRILWDAPLDVVYAANGNIIQVFTSYE